MQFSCTRTHTHAHTNTHSVTHPPTPSIYYSGELDATRRFAFARRNDRECQTVNPKRRSWLTAVVPLNSKLVGKNDEEYRLASFQDYPEQSKQPKIYGYNRNLGISSGPNKTIRAMAISLCRDAKPETKSMR